MLKQLVAVNLVEGIGPIKLKKLLFELGSIEAVAQRLNAPLDKAEEEIRNAAEKKLKIFSYEDERYPEILKQIHDPPIVLYIRGELKPEDSNSIAIVGTRKPTPFGLEVAKRFARELAGLGITIVSGLAFGIDAAAHAGALEAGGRTIAVLGSGVDRITPAGNRELGFDILEKGGAIVSEYPLGAEPGAWSFPRRNRIISGLSRGVIVVEGGYESGAMITAKLAIEQGREVFAVPGNIGSETSRGPHWLIKQGAKLTESIDDVLDELGNVIKVNRPNDFNRELILGYTNKKTLPDMLPNEAKIYALLSSEPKQIDEIVNDSGLEVQNVSSILMLLEIKGLVKPLPGKYFVVV